MLENAKIIPIPKGGGEFRPIAILPFLSKVFELLIYKQINAFVSKHSLLCNRQSGFRKSHNCITALIDVIENIRKAIDNDELTF